MTATLPNDTDALLDRLAAVDEPANDARLRLWSLLGDVDYYEAWLYAEARADAEPDREPDAYLFSATRDELLGDLAYLPAALSGRVVVKAMVGGIRCPVDPYGNALDPLDLHVVANAV